MNIKIIWAIVAIVAIGGIYFLMTDTTKTSPQGIATPAEQQLAPTTPVLKVATDTTLGSYLTAGNGLTLYLFTKDTPGTTTCYDACATNWPPYIVPAAGALAAESSVTGNIGTVQRKDGTIQVTYNSMPLYFWIKDTKAGDTTGQNVGGVWFVVKP